MTVVPGRVMQNIGGVFRQENSNTAIMSAIAASDGTINGNARLVSGSIRQVSSEADVAANLGVHSAEVEAEVGKWVPFVYQVQITSINTAADTDPPTTTTRGAGATWRMWLADGLIDSATTTFSSYRGSANVFGFRANRSALGIIGSGGSLSLLSRTLDKPAPTPLSSCQASLTRISAMARHLRPFRWIRP